MFDIYINDCPEFVIFSSVLCVFINQKTRQYAQCIKDEFGYKVLFITNNFSQIIEKKVKI